MAKGFQFRFASLLQLLRQQREQAGREVGDAEQAIGILQQQVTDLKTERAGLQQVSQSLRQGSVLSVDRLLNQGRYDLQLAAQLEDLRGKTKQVEDERERRLAVLREADAEVRRLEKLQEQQWAQWQQAEQQRQQAALDDLAAGRYLRQLRASELASTSEGKD